MRIAVGMSGGVDSSVAAFLMKDRGDEVFGVTMRIWSGPEGQGVRGHACYGPGEEDDIRGAREACEAIGIPHHVFDCSRAYRETVLDYFKREYLAGRTPNPCILCNQRIKFDLLPALANDALDVEAFATGHYARTGINTGDNRITLRKARDPLKDQSYFLHRLTQGQLRRAVFPIGGYTKEQVREIARREGIPSCDRPESQDFYDGDYRDLFGRCDEPGDIVDANGTALGTHRGIWNYTIGQRRGLGVSSYEPLYVVGIDVARRRIIAGTRNETLNGTFLATHFNWVSTEAIIGNKAFMVKTRSSHPGAPCIAEPLDSSTVRITLDRPEPRAPAGQSAVLYDGDLLIGGGIIEYEHRGGHHS